MTKIMSFIIISYALITNIFATLFLNVSFINKNNTNQIQYAENGINEQDFINTMFLKPEFFENWAETNYFINPTLKTSKPLKYSKNWYLDYMKDSFSSSFSTDSVSSNFLSFFNDYYPSLKDDYEKILTKMPKGLFTEKQEQILFNLFPKNKDNFLYDVFYIFLDLAGLIFLINNPPKLLNDQIAYKFNDRLVANRFDYFQYIPSSDGYWHYDRLNFIRIVPKSDSVLFLYSFVSFSLRFISNWEILADELIRVNNGGLPIYDFDKTAFTQKVLFSFEIVDENEDKRKIYKMIMTVDKNNTIFAGNLQLIYSSQKGPPLHELNFSLNWLKQKDNSFNANLQFFSFNSSGRQILSDLKGIFNLDLFLQKFFSSALIPVFQNRSSFIESDFLTSISYDTVLINFFGINDLEFKGLFLNIANDKIDQFDAAIRNLLNLSKSFYKDYLRILFDMNNKTYVQGYNKEYGLLANNGFKIYPRYFYFSDRYNKLTLNLYSAYQNRFYKTKFGNVFNYDWTVDKSEKLEGANRKYIISNNFVKFPFKYLFLDSKNIGYNVFELKAEKQNNIYKYYYFNFGIYNWQEITKDGLMPDKQWWDTNYESCSWYNIFCHIKNAVKWTVNTIPGVSQTVKLVSGVGEIYKSVVNFFQDIFEFWKFSPALYHTITSLFILIVFMKLVRFI